MNRFVRTQTRGGSVFDENAFGYFVFDFFLEVSIAQHEESHHRIRVVEVEALHFGGDLFPVSRSFRTTERTETR